MSDADAGDDRIDLGRFLDDLRRTGTVIDGPKMADDWDPVPVEWSVSAHRGQPIDPPYRLELDDREFAEALSHDAAVVGRWWPGSDALDTARDALLLSFDAALVGVDETPHGFVLEEDGRLRMTTHHLCPDPIPHLDPEGDYHWSAFAPGDPEFEEEQERLSRQSPHRRHADVVRAWLVVEAAMGSAELDLAVPYLQDQVERTFGPGTSLRFSDHVQAWNLPDDEMDAELRSIAYSDDERLDALLDALAGEPRDN
jgi:hypothetical protein